MPPKPGKKAEKGPSAKTINKEKAKVVEDKTFGLKNKNKSKVVQSYIKGVQTQVMHGQVKGGAARMEQDQRAAKAETKKSAEQKALFASLFKGVVQLKTDDTGQVLDNKLQLCAYFKAGVCEKGKKCKYSHDLSLEDKKTANIDIYSDPRQKIGKVPDTIITCKTFIDAVENNQYGFNWVCPNGGDDCQYRHMLPQGYVLNRDKGGDQESSDDEMTLEEKIEEERAALRSEDLTPVTADTFAAWKKRRAEQKEEELERKIKEEEAKGKKDRSQMKFMSGRALFTFNPDMFVDDEAAGGANDYEEEETKQQESTKDMSAVAEVDEQLFEEGDEVEDVDFD